LETRFERSWNTLLVKALAGLESKPDRGTENELLIVYKFMAVVARSLRSRDFTLLDVLNQLKADGRLKDDHPDTEATAIQLTFAALGWLTMLYNPKLCPEPRKLEIAGLLDTYKKKDGMRSRVLTTFSQDLPVYHQPFHHLLRLYGNLVPQLTPQVIPEADYNYSTQNHREVYVTMNNVCFHTLHEVIHIKVAWCDTLNQHLELDEAKKTLKLFRFPSFCRMMCGGYQDNQLLYR
jgi:hypothetical protein